MSNYSAIPSLLVVAFVACGCVVGCGSPQEDPCADETCAFGTCDPDDGDCVNAASCSSSEECLPAYECGEKGTCVAKQSCKSDGDCKVGVCRDGVCANPEKCTKDGQCLEGTYCDVDGDAGTGSCEPDPCRDIRCPRGVCKTGTERCVSKQSCTRENELRDCVEGERCADGSCVEIDEYCDAITCKRGVCSLQERGCTNADECQKDGDCLAGYFCNGMNLCQRDLCKRDGVDCGNGGVCQPKSGHCENASKCNSNADCLADHLCVKGTCRHASTACGDAGGDGGCPGNQTCAYDADRMTVQCRTPKFCETTLDCKGDKRCNGRHCIGQESTCDDDRFEGNDKKKDATPFLDNAQKRALWASVCKGNSDYYRVKTTDIVGRTTRGRLVVEVDVPRRDRGLGKVKLELIDDQGNTQGRATTGALGADGVARVTKRILIHEHGTYRIKVSAGDRMRKPGVGYRLSVDLLPDETVSACRDAQEIRVGQRVTGSTTEGTSSALGSRCTTARNSATEKIYRLDLQHPQELKAAVTPETQNGDLAVSLRRRCLQRSSELACADGAGRGGKERLTRVVGPGSYYLVVQAPEGEVGGAFRLKVDRVYTSCSPSSNYCDAKGNAHECRRDGTRFRTLKCDNGCDRSRGRCVPPDGDICGTAKTIDPMNTQPRTLLLDQANDTYQVVASRCLGYGKTQTGGPDLAWEVKVPARKSVRLETKFTKGVEGAMYLVENCAKVDGTCKAGVQDSTSDDDREVLQYSNTSMTDETLYLIVDTDAGQQVGTWTLQVRYENVVCAPGSKQCRSGDVHTCGEYGTKFTSTTSCGSLGCKSGSCVGDSCGSAVSVPTNGTKQTYSWRPANYTDDYDISYASCLSDDSDGNDVVFAVAANQGDIIDVNLQMDDARLYVVEKGGCTNVRSNCLLGREGYSSTSFEWQAPKTKTYYIIADRDNFGIPGQSSIDITVSKPQCKPSTYTSSCSGNTLKKCDTGQIVSQTCALGCSSGSCDGESCTSAVDATAAAGQSGGVTYSANWGKFTDDINGDACGTSGPGASIDSIDTDGRETVYRIDLLSGETLTASLPPPGDVSLYLKASALCGSNGTACLAGDEAEASTASISYSASSNETVYLIADRERDYASDTFSLDIDVK